MRRQIFMLAVLVGVVAGHSQATAQVKSSEAPVRVLIQNGDDVRNNVNAPEDVPLRVQVEDGNGNAAAGARVEFAAPDTGPSGVFAHGSPAIALTADESGSVEVRGFRPNNTPGPFEIQVKAFYQGNQGTAVIRQTNVGSSGSKKLLARLAGAGGGAAAIAATCC